MKKNILYIMFAAFCLVNIFTACDPSVTVTNPPYIGIGTGSPGNGGTNYTTDSWSPTGTSPPVYYDISKMTLNNTANALIITLDFADNIAGWENDRITIFIDNTASSAGGASYQGAEAWEKSAADYVTVINGSLEGYVYQRLPKLSSSGTSMDDPGIVEGGTSSITSWTISNWALIANPETTSVTYTIPFSNIASPAVGDVVKVFAAISNCWTTAGGTVIVMDVIPAIAATGSRTDEQNDTLTVDMEKAFAYTIAQVD